jgi:hypothetical protein
MEQIVFAVVQSLMRIGRCFGQSITAYILVAGALVFGETEQRLDLDHLLSQIEDNTDRYNATVPSFICNEHILSQEFHEGRLKRETSVDAVFTVTRSASQANALEESREVKSINGKPAAGKKLSLPISFSGGFSGALTKFLSRDHRSCFDYAADASTPSAEGAAAFTFTAKADAAKEPACASIQPGTTGKFVVDTASMQVTHIERTVPNPVGKDQTVVGTAAVDYAAVAFNGKTFWLPTTITAFTDETAKTGSFRFTARYTGYHRFASTASIVPTDK